MKQLWTADELGESWTLSHDEFVFLEKRRGARNRLGFALQLKHYQLYARFLNGGREVAGDVIEYVVDQLGRHRTKNKTRSAAVSTAAHHLRNADH